MSYYSCTILVYSRQVSQVFVRPVDYGHLAAAAAAAAAAVLLLLSAQVKVKSRDQWGYVPAGRALLP